MKPYRVEPRGEGCPQCTHGDQWDIIGPGEVAQSQSWGEPAEAIYICELMNDAYAQGRASFAEQILNLTKDEETENAEGQTIVEAPKPFSTTTAEGDDIPF